MILIFPYFDWNTTFIFKRFLVSPLPFRFCNPFSSFGHLQVFVLVVVHGTEKLLYMSHLFRKHPKTVDI